MNKQKLVFSSGIANTFEWYDYALFGLLAPIFSNKFFPENDPQVALLNGFLLFAVGYLMRPIGGIFFGIIGDKFGRKAALSASIICMAFPTTLISILPTYDSIGIWATILMVIVRMLQGISMGGALTGSVSFLIEHTDKKHRGIAGSIPMASIALGILLASLTLTIIRSFMSEEDFVSWGWRLPFVLGIFVMFAGFYIKKYTQETPLFNEIKARDQILKSPLKKAIKSYWLDIIISILINATGSVIFYMQAIYIMNYLTIERGVDGKDISYMVNISYIVMIFVTIFAGWLSDIVGRKKIFAINLIAIALSSFFLMDIFAHGDLNSIWFAQIIFAIFAAMYIGPEPALQAEFFPTNVRNTALSLAYNTGTSLFGGTTPFVLHLLYYKTGNVLAASYYVIGCTLVSLTALIFYKDRS